MKVLVDTSIWSLALRRRPHNLNDDETKLKNVLSELVNDARVAIIGPIRQELLSGLREHAQFLKMREALRAFLDITLQTADFERAAEMNNECSSQGVATSLVDMLICSVAAKSKYPIFTADEDFRRYSAILRIPLFETERT